MLKMLGLYLDTLNIYKKWINIAKFTKLQNLNTNNVFLTKKLNYKNLTQNQT